MGYAKAQKHGNVDDSSARPQTGEETIYGMPDPRNQILDTRSFLPDPDFQNLATISRLSDNRYQTLGTLIMAYQILIARSWLPDPGCQILAARSWILLPGYQILATRSKLPDIRIPDPGHQVPGFRS